MFKEEQIKFVNKWNKPIHSKKTGKDYTLFILESEDGRQFETFDDFFVKEGVFGLPVHISYETIEDQYGIHRKIKSPPKEEGSKSETGEPTPTTVETVDYGRIRTIVREEVEIAKTAILNALGENIVVETGQGFKPKG